MRQYIVTGNHTDQRLDQVLPELAGDTRSYWARAIKLGNVTLNGEKVRPSTTVRLDDVIDIAERSQIDDVQDLPIVYQDDDIVIVNKPAGMLVHHADRHSNELTVIDAVADLVEDEDDRPGVVHRLDRNTSGLVIVARNPMAKLYMQDLFKAHLVEKTYQAIIVGHLDLDEALIDVPVGRTIKSGMKRVITPNGREAKTNYKVLQNFAGYSLVELKPTTGRTHQLRVHMAHLGHPIVGDNLYGGKIQDIKAGRQMLHAGALDFLAPSGSMVNAVVDCPEDFKMIIKGLGEQV